MFQLIVNIIITTSIYTLIATSFSVVFTSTKVFNISQAAIISFGAYLTFLFYSLFQAPFWLSIPLAISTTLILGVLFEILIFKQMRIKKLPKYTFMIASIGLYVVFQNTISLVFGDETKIINLSPNQVSHIFFGAYITTIQLLTIIISFSLFSLFYFWSKYSSSGKLIRAVSNNPELSSIYGISVNKVTIWCICISSFFGAIAGILSSLDTNMTPTFGFNLFMYGVVAMIIGGVGSYKGIIFGSVLVATTQHSTAFFIDTKWMDAIAYIILILFLIWKPYGFSGQRIRKIEI